MRITALPRVELGADVDARLPCADRQIANLGACRGNDDLAREPIQRLRHVGMVQAQIVEHETGVDVERPVRSHRIRDDVRVCGKRDRAAGSRPGQRVIGGQRQLIEQPRQLDSTRFEGNRDVRRRAQRVDGTGRRHRNPGEVEVYGKRYRIGCKVEGYVVSDGDVERPDALIRGFSGDAVQCQVPNRGDGTRVRVD